MQHLLKSIYNNRWFPFQIIPLSSSPRPSSPLLVAVSPSESSGPIASTSQPSLEPSGQDHHFQFNASIPRSTIANQFHLLRITSTSLSLSVSFSCLYLSNQLVHPIISLNSQSWYNFILLDQAQPCNSHLKLAPSDQAHALIHHSSFASLTILIYGLEPGTVYDVDVELTFLDQHSPLHLASNPNLRNDNPLDDTEQHMIAPLPNSLSIIESELNHADLKLTDASPSTQTQVAPIDPDAPPPPYTSHDPASPTRTCTSDMVESSSHSFSSLESSFNISSAETSVDSGVVPASRPGYTNEEEQALRTELEKQALALREAIEENAPLKQTLHDLEQLIKRLDEENTAKSAELLIYDELKIAQLEKTIEGQKEELKRKTEQCKVLEEKNHQKLDNLKQTNQVLKTRWEDSVQKIEHFKEKTLKPVEEEIDELIRQLCECEKDIKSIDRETQKRAIQHSNQFQVVRSRSSGKKNNSKPSASNVRGSSNEAAQTQVAGNHRNSKWKSMDDFKFINPPSIGPRTNSTHPMKRIPIGEFSLSSFFGIVFPPRRCRFLDSHYASIHLRIAR
ncbi:hypothetical protein VP01_1201g5 [Puccinia sorghi]|uniref:Uncharacterized protein n=1 Tax=Puccinia sorghi TaxID=27349 RepID=A0A0L6VQI9_9BASI|nr:hypothetical protein VP01_1201g5 [Puccinia sorghi]